MNLTTAIEKLSRIGNGVWTMPDGEERMLYDLVNGIDPTVSIPDDTRVFVEWSGNTVYLTEYVDGGYRGDSFGRIVF